MTAAPAMTVARLMPWFGANTSLAGVFARQLGKVRWCAVPFAGGMAELPWIDTVAGVAGDLHRHIINLARVVSDPRCKAILVEHLDSLLFHPDILRAAQLRNQRREESFSRGLFSPTTGMDTEPDAQWAADYFICGWMGRGGHAGKKTEFGHGLALRYTSSGGDSAKRLRSAIESLEAWHFALRKWSFDCVDAFELLARVRDQDDRAIYVDPPWPETGLEYKHCFGQHGRLCEVLSAFKHCRVVVRYGDHPLIADLYDRPPWTIQELNSRNQKNNDVSELLIVNGPLYPKPKECAQ
jgi:DNA adenine methylase